MGGWAIAVHGGAGVDPKLPLECQEQAKQLLTRCLNLGISALRSNLPAIDVVELVVRPYLSVMPCLVSIFVPISPYHSLWSLILYLRTETNNDTLCDSNNYYFNWFYFCENADFLKNKNCGFTLALACAL